MNTHGTKTDLAYLWVALMVVAIVVMVSLVVADSRKPGGGSTGSSSAIPTPWDDADVTASRTTGRALAAQQGVER